MGRLRNNWWWLMLMILLCGWWRGGVARPQLRESHFWTSSTSVLNTEFDFSVMKMEFDEELFVAAGLSFSLSAFLRSAYVGSDLALFLIHALP